MPLNIKAIEDEIESENEKLKDMIQKIAHDESVTQEQATAAALIACNVAIYQRLGDLISMVIRT